MAKTKRQKQRQPKVHELTYTNGQQVWQVRYQVNGKRQSQVFKTKAEAEAEVSRVRLKITNEGAAAFDLPADVRTEAVKAIEALKPYEGETISKAVAYYIEHVLTYHNAPTVAVIVKKMLAEAQANKRRERTVKDLRLRLGKFANTFGKRKLAALTLEELKAWIDDPTLSARTRINYATKVSQVYNFALREGWVDENLVDRIKRPTAEDGDPGIFTVEQAANLLTHADKYHLLPYVAIGLFAGLRSAELLRLDWGAVKLGERCIIIDASVAKKRSRRVVEINDTLAAWLATCVKAKGPVVSVPSLQKALNGLAGAAGVTEWPHNGLRHSFASYHLAKHGDATKTAFQMGNSAVIVHNHYKGLVTNGDVDRFWSLRPAGADAEKIVPMQAAANG